MKSEKKVVAITGTSGFLGGLLLQELLKAPWCTRIIALDAYPPDHRAKVTYHPLPPDPMEEEKGLSALLRHHHCTTFVHAAMPQRPMRNMERSHELLSVATMYLLHAVAEANIPHLILGSTTEVYGAKPTNPNMMGEDSKRQAGHGNPFLKDKTDVEEQFERYATVHPKSVVTILRTCPILGQSAPNWTSQFLGQKIVPMVAGYDPLIQFIHEHDVLRAYLQVIQHPHGGAFNVVGGGVVPLSKALAMAGKAALPMPSPLLYLMADFLWQASISPVPSASLDFLKYGCVGDGAKAKRVFGFEAVYNSEEALITFLDAHRMEE